MIISDARSFLKNVAPGGNDSSEYTDVMVDQAIQSVCNDFLHRAPGATRITGDLLLSAGASVLPSFGSPAAGSLTGFRTEYLLRAYLTNAPPVPNNNGEPPSLAITDYLDVLDAITNGAQTGMPTIIGFDSNTSGAVYPTTDIAYTLRLLWSPAFTSWAFGTTDAGVLATALNLPDEYLQPILRWGGVYFLAGNKPENRIALSAAWQNYLDFVATVKSRGIGTSGKQVSFRTPPGSSRRRRTITGFR